MTGSKHPPVALVGVAFLLSGFTSLVLQVVWSKALALLLGSTLHAVSTVVAVFLGGLALGAYLAGRHAHRLKRPLAAYGILEIGVGLYAFLSLLLLGLLDPIVASTYASLGPTSPLYLGVRVLLSGLVLLPPTILMGATLPWLVAWATRAGGSFGQSLGRLYGINTLGAVLGASTAGFLLVPNLGLKGSAYAVGTLAILLGAAIYVIGSREAAMEPVQPTTGDDRPPRAAHSRRWVAALLFAVSGAVALTLEVAWARIFGLIFGSSVYSFALVLTAYLAGIALGSILWGSKLADSKHPWRAFAILQVALAAGVVFGLWLLPELPQLFVRVLLASRSQLTTVYLTQAALAGSIALIPCLALGAIFPVGARILGGNQESAAEATGLAYTLNTAGTVTGTLLAGFLLLPRLGVHPTLIGAALVALALAAAAWLADPDARARQRPAPQPAMPRGKKRQQPAAPPAPQRSSTPAGAGIGLITVLLVVLVGAVLAPRWDRGLFTLGIYRSVLARPEGLSPGAARREIQQRLSEEKTLYYREGVHGVVSVHEFHAIPGALTLRINGKPDASTTGDVATQVMLGHLPMLWAPPDAEVCVIGHGSGITARAALAHEPSRLTIVEIEPAVLEASRFFDDVTDTVLDDPRVEVVIEDGRQHLVHSGRRYDVIISEPSNPWIAGINSLFTVDFYRQARAALSPGGTFCIWIQMYELSPEALSSLLAAIHEVFPAAEAFRFGDDFVIIAPSADTWASGRALLPETSSDAALGYLSRFTFHQDGYVAAHHFSSVAGIVDQLPPAPLNTDDRPFVEYRAPFDLFKVSGPVFRTQQDEMSEPDFYAGLERWVEGSYLDRVALAAGHILARSGEAARAEALTDALAPRLDPESADWLALDADVTRGHDEEQAADALQRAERAFITNDLRALGPELAAAFAIAPHSPAAHLMSGRAAMRVDSLASARSHLLETARYGDPAQRCEAYVNLGIVAMREGRIDMGRQAFEAARRAQPGEPIAYINLARWYAQSSYNDSATAVLELGLREAFPTRPIQDALAAHSQSRGF